MSYSVSSEKACTIGILNEAKIMTMKAVTYFVSIELRVLELRHSPLKAIKSKPYLKIKPTRIKHRKQNILTMTHIFSI